MTERPTRRRFSLGSLAILAIAVLGGHPAAAQQVGRMTFVVAQGNAVQRLQFLEGEDLALQVRQMLNQGAMSGVSTPLVLDGEMHEQRFRQGGDPATFTDRRFNRTVVRGYHRDIVLSYGPSRKGGLGVFTSVDESTLTPGIDGSVSETPGEHSEITGTVPANGRPYALAKQVPPPPGITLLPKTLIILVEP